MSHDSRNAGLSLLLALAIVTTVSASARWMYSDSKASAEQITESTAQDVIACQ